MGASEEARQSNRGHLEDIRVFEKDVRIKLRSKLLKPDQVRELSSLQFPTLSELRALVNEQSLRRQGSRPTETDNH